MENLGNIVIWVMKIHGKSRISWMKMAKHVLLWGSVWDTGYPRNWWIMIMSPLTWPFWAVPHFWTRPCTIQAPSWCSFSNLFHEVTSMVPPIPRGTWFTPNLVSSWVVELCEHWLFKVIEDFSSFKPQNVVNNIINCQVDPLWDCSNQSCLVKLVQGTHICQGLQIVLYPSFLGSISPCWSFRIPLIWNLPIFPCLGTDCARNCVTV